MGGPALRRTGIQGGRPRRSPRRRVLGEQADRRGLAGRYLRALPADGQLLYGPAVAVRIAEEDERAPVEVLHLAYLDPALDQLGTRGPDVRDDELQALDRARRRVDDPGSQGDRAGRSGRRQLDKANLIADPVVVVRVEADLLGVERLGAVHVRDRN